MTDTKTTNHRDMITFLSGLNTLLSNEPDVPGNPHTSFTILKNGIVHQSIKELLEAADAAELERKL